MIFAGRIHREGKFWIAEIPALDLATQGLTREEAFRMAGTVVEDVLGLDDFKATVRRGSGDTFMLSGSDTDALIALMLRQQRTKRGLTVLEASRRLGSRSPNAFGAYEQGKRRPSIGKLEELLSALDPELSALIKVG